MQANKAPFGGDFGGDRQPCDVWSFFPLKHDFHRGKRRKLRLIAACINVHQNAQFGNLFVKYMTSDRSSAVLPSAARRKIGLERSYDRRQHAAYTRALNHGLDGNAIVRNPKGGSRRRLISLFFGKSFCYSPRLCFNAATEKICS